MEKQETESVNTETQASDNYEKLFRTAVLGFNKDDVIYYLNRIAKERRKESERYAIAVHAKSAEALLNEDSDVRALSDSENAALKSENEMLRIQIQELEETAKLSAGEQSNENTPSDSDPELLNVRILELEEALSKAEADVQEAQNANAALKTENGLLTERCAAENAVKAKKEQQIAELEKRLEENDAACEQLKEKIRLLEQNQGKAEAAVQDARFEATRLKAEAYINAGQIVQDAQNRISDLSATLDEIDRQVEEASREYMERLNICSANFDSLKASTADLRSLVEGTHV